MSFLDPNHALCPKKRDACALYARRQGGKTYITLHPTIRDSTCFMVSRRAVLPRCVGRARSIRKSAMKRFP